MTERADASDDGPARLYATTYVRLVSVLAVAAGSRAEAEEVVQEAFVRLLPRWSVVSRYDNPEAWVRSVAFRLLSNRHRRARVARRVLGRSGPAEHSPPASAERVDVRRALAALPLAQRQVVVLHHLLDLPVAEIAAELGLPIGTVKSRLSRSRDALARLLGEEVKINA